MAKRDIILRFAQSENEYLEMRDLVKELKTDLESGKIPAEYYNEKTELLAQEIETTKQKYLFWSEVLFELNKPNRKGKELDATTLSWYNEIKTLTKDSIMDDSKDPLKNLKELIKSGEIK